MKSNSDKIGRKRAILLLFLTSMGAFGFFAANRAAGSTSSASPDAPTQAFDTSTGTLNVNYASYLSKHDVVYNKPNANPLHGLTVGNGKVGAMVWCASGLSMQVSGVDTSPQTAFSAGLVNLATTPALDAAPMKFQQRLNLYDGLLTTRYDADRTVTILGVPGAEVLGIHVDDARQNVTSITVELSLWDVSKLANSASVADLDTWKKVETFADARTAGLSRGQADKQHFGYTLAATVEGTPFTTQTLPGNKVRLTITPSASYTIWIACASRLNAPGHDSLAQARKLLGKARTAGHAATLKQYVAFWHDFWSRSFIQYGNANGDADYLENLYYLAMYQIASGAYGNYPCHFINGVFRASQDATRWSNAYWFWNQRDVYNSFLTSNHADLLAGFNRLYSRNFDTLKAFTKSRFQIDGIWVPETMGWNGSAEGTIHSPFTSGIFSTGAEVALNMYDYHAYTGDAAYLKSTAYPFMREVAKFYVKKFTLDRQTGKYVMEKSNAHETYWNVRNATTDLAAVRSLFPLTIRTSKKLGVDAPLRRQWQDLLDNLTPYPTDGKHYLPHQPPIAKQRNGENVAAEIIWPYSVTGIDAADHEMSVRTWRARPSPYDNIWANDAIQAARLGLGAEANHGMKVMLQKYQNYPNGLTANTNGVFEYLGVHLIAMNESLLQSYNDRIRVFPALPGDAGMVARFTLAAKGGFLVTSEMEGGEVKYVGLKSLLGKPACIVNPWRAAQARVRRVDGAGKLLLTSSDANLKFSTEANAVYVIERTAKPLTRFSYTQLTGNRNQEAKRLSSSCTLGIPSGPWPDTGKYEAEDARLVNCSISNDLAASNLREVTGLRQGSSMTFANVRSGSAIDIRYATFANPGKLSLYINGKHEREVLFPTTQSWEGVYRIVTVQATVPQGATLKLQWDKGGAGTNIDWIQVRRSK